MVLANVRGAEEREGDILAQMAATRDAEEHLHRIFAEHGTDTVLAAVAAIHDRAEAQMREALAAIPDGVYAGRGLARRRRRGRRAGWRCGCG